jgi:hypothetical protein
VTTKLQNKQNCRKYHVITSNTSTNKSCLRIRRQSAADHNRTLKYLLVVRQNPNLGEVMTRDEANTANKKTRVKVTALKDKNDKHIDINN